MTMEGKMGFQSSFWFHKANLDSNHIELRMEHAYATGLKYIFLK